MHIARLPNPVELDHELSIRNYNYIGIACEPWEWRKLKKLPLLGSRTKAYGIHPMIAGKVNEEYFNELHDILKQDKTAQIGEAGLDKRYPGYGEGEIQEFIFTRQASLALELKRNLQIHCVGDYGRIIQILKKLGFGKTARPIFHRFGGDSEIVKAALPLGAIFSLHKDSFRKKSTAAAIKEIPAENIRFETDADESWTEILNGSNAQNAATLAKELSEISI